MNWGGCVYHRYVPNANGTYDRQVVETPSQQPIRLQSRATCPPPEPIPPACETCPHRENASSRGHFLSRLLPRGLDSGDLLVLAILLLLLIDGNEDDLMSVLVTIAAFLFL